MRDVEARRQLALQKKAEEERAKAQDEEKKRKDEGEKRKREREETTEKRPLKTATKKVCIRILLAVPCTNYRLGGRYI